VCTAALLVALCVLVALTLPGTASAASSWSAQTSGIATALTAIDCTSTTQCWAVGASGVIRVTTNGGTTWTAQTSGTTNALNAIRCASTTQCWAVGASGTIITTTTGGTTWTTQTSGTTNALAGIDCVSTTQCWAVGASGTIVATSNGGTAWAAQTSGTSANLAGTKFPSASAGWAVGASGVIVVYAPCSGGSLGLATPASFTFPSVTLNGTNQSVSTTLVVTPDDETTAGSGWNITATSTTLTNASSQTLPSTATTLTSASSAAASGNCSLPTNAITYPVTVPAGPTAPTAVKIYNAASATGKGPANVTLTAQLSVPASAYKGTYTSTWTLAIVSGP
jgi:hypothetical protein